MEGDIGDPTRQIKRLQRCINDLVSILSLPAVWGGGELEHILSILLDALVGMLGLDFVCARLRRSIQEPPIEVLKTAQSSILGDNSQQIREALNGWFVDEPNTWPPSGRSLIGNAEISIVSLHLGLQGEIGIIIAASTRADFPQETERLLLSVAANQAALGLQQTRQFSEQKRLAAELDLRVAERTTELATINEELRKEIVERKLTEERLRLNEDALRAAHTQVARSEERWRSVFETSAIGVALTDLNGRFIATNPVYQKMLGYSEEALEKLSFLDVTHEEDHELNRTLVIELLEGKRQQFQIEKRYRRQNGDLIWVRNNISIVPGTERVPQFMMALSEDITERKHFEVALQASELYLRQTIDGIPGIVCTMNARGEIERVNRQTLEYFGRPFEQLRNWAESGTVHPDDLPHVLSAFVESVETGKPYDVEHRCLRADGMYRWFQVRALPLHNEKGDTNGWYVLLTDIHDRKLAEEALQASERKLSLIINTMPVLTWSARPDGSAEFVNQRWLDYTGFSADQAKGWGWTEALHPDDIDRMTGAWQSTVLTGEQLEVEGRLRRFDGEYRWFLFRANPLRDASGAIVKWYGANIDIEDRKHAEEAMRASESELSLIVDTIPTLAWSCRPDGYADFHNRRYLEYTGLTLEQVQGFGWHAAMHPNEIADVSDYWARIVSGGLLGEKESRLRRFDGTYRWFLFRSNPLRDISGAIVKWYGTCVDIDDRKRAEERLQRSEAFLAEGQRLSRTGAFSWRTETNEVAWSDELYRIYEIPQSTPATLDLTLIRVHPEDVAKLNDVAAQSRAIGADFEHEHRLLMPDRSVKYLHITAHATRDPNGALEYIGAAQDVTQRRLSEEALSQARSELAHVARITSLGALTASIAHEVNQPLSGIITNASTCLRMLSGDPPNIDGARETARRTIRDGNRTSEVIARLRAMFSKKDFIAEAVDLNDAALEVIALSQSELQQNRVSLKHELAENLPFVKGDRVQLQQVILNLLRNALEAMSSVEDWPRRLLIVTEQETEDHVRLSVQDTGIGFEPQVADRLFEAFYTTKNDGMGIGLSLCRSIVEAHSGRLWAFKNSGPGATFAFSIPIEPSTAAVTPAGSA